MQLSQVNPFTKLESVVQEQDVKASIKLRFDVSFYVVCHDVVEIMATMFNPFACVALKF